MSSELVCPSSAQYSDNRYLLASMSSVSGVFPSTSRINASGMTPYPPMPVSDIGRKGRRVDKVIPLLL